MCRRLRSRRSLLEDEVEVSEDFAGRCEDSDDQLDAFVSAIVAWCLHTDRADPIPQGLHWVAQREGWIRLPLADSLAALTEA